MKESRAWFAVRCVFRADGALPDLGSDEAAYEERLTLWRSSSADAAIALAEAEATAYAVDVGSTYLEFAQAYALADDPGHGAEVFSLIRYSDLEPTDYLDTFFDTGRERQT